MTPPTSDSSDPSNVINGETRSTGDGNKLRENISKTMGWWSPDGYDAYPEKTDEVTALIQEETRKAKAETARYISEELFKLDPMYGKPDGGDKFQMDAEAAHLVVMNYMLRLNHPENEQK